MNRFSIHYNPERFSEDEALRLRSLFDCFKDLGFDSANPHVVFISDSSFEELEDFNLFVFDQARKYRDVFFVIITNGKHSLNYKLLEKKNARFFMSSNDFFRTAQIEFIVSQIIWFKSWDTSFSLNRYKIGNFYLDMKAVEIQKAYFEFILQMLGANTSSQTINLFDQCIRLILDLGNTLYSKRDEAYEALRAYWDIKAGVVERSTLKALYATWIGMDLGIEDLNSLARSALLLDIGQLKIADISEMQKFPVLSLQQALLKKIEISKTVRENILCAYERFDRKGFPNQVSPELISEQAMILHYVALLDKYSVNQVNKSLIGLRDTKRNLIIEAADKQLSQAFLEKMKRSI